MSPDRRRRTGALGERLAAEHLTRAGYEILSRNFRTRSGEIDLVVADARSIVFCEVKTRVAGTRSGPAGALDAIGPKKRRQLQRMAGHWLNSGVPHPHRDGLRFDAIAVTVSPGGRALALEHVRDAF